MCSSSFHIYCILLFMDNESLFSTLGMKWASLWFLFWFLWVYSLCCHACYWVISMSYLDYIEPNHQLRTTTMFPFTQKKNHHNVKNKIMRIPKSFTDEASKNVLLIVTYVVVITCTWLVNTMLCFRILGLLFLVLTVNKWTLVDKLFIRISVQRRKSWIK